ARVLILESTSQGGGNCPHSGGNLFDAPDLPDDRFLDHLSSLCFGRTDRSVLSTYARGLHELPAWLASLGARAEPFAPPGRFPASFPSWPHFPAGNDISYRITPPDHPGERPGRALWRILSTEVERRGIQVHYNSTVEELLLD